MYLKWIAMNQLRVVRPSRLVATGTLPTDNPRAALARKTFQIENESVSVAITAGANPKRVRVGSG
jgi:hypothetical protein